MMPKLKMKHKIALMSMDDNLAFMPDSEDLKTLLKQFKKKQLIEKTSDHSKRSKGLWSREFWDHETIDLPEWYNFENVMQREMEMLKKEEENEEEEEVIEETFDKKNFVTNEQLEKIMEAKEVF